MKNEIRKAVPLSTQMEDQIFNLHDKAWELLENESISLAKEKVMEAWNLLPEPKYNTACTGMTLRAMHEILTKSKDYDELENFFTQWTTDIENCGYQIINFEAFILLAEIYLFKNQIDKAKEIFAKTKKYKAPKMKAYMKNHFEFLGISSPKRRAIQKPFFGRKIQRNSLGFCGKILECRVS